MKDNGETQIMQAKQNAQRRDTVAFAQQHLDHCRTAYLMVAENPTARKHARNMVRDAARAKYRAVYRKVRRDVRYYKALAKSASDDAALNDGRVEKAQKQLEEYGNHMDHLHKLLDGMGVRPGTLDSRIRALSVEMKDAQNREKTLAQQVKDHKATIQAQKDDIADWEAKHDHALEVLKANSLRADYDELAG